MSVERNTDKILDKVNVRVFRHLRSRHGLTVYVESATQRSAVLPRSDLQRRCWKGQELDARQMYTQHSCHYPGGHSRVWPKTVRLIAHLFIGLTALRGLASRPLPIPSLTISTTSCRVSSLAHSFAHDSLKPLDVRKISSPPLRTNSHITLVPMPKLSSPPTSLTPLMSFPSRSQIYWSILGSNLLPSVAMNSPPSLIVIDALDEIEDEGGSGFLQDLLQVINQNDLHGLKFLVTSRQDPTIVSLCESFNSKRVCHLHEVDTQEVKKDIMTYLTDKLSALHCSASRWPVHLRCHWGEVYITFVSQVSTPRTVLPTKKASSSLATTHQSQIGHVSRHVVPSDSYFHLV